MNPAVWLFIYAGLLGWAVDPFLARSRWVHRSPSAALLAWHGTALGVTLGLTCGLYLLAHDVAEHGFARLLHADKTQLHMAYASNGEVPEYWNASLAAVAVLGLAIVVTTGIRLRAQRADSAAHQLAVTQVRTVSTGYGRTQQLGVLASAVPAIYCVASGRRRSRIVVTTGVLQLLSAQRLGAAVEHEVAHLRRHHHAMVLLADIVHSLARRIGMLRHYPQAVRQLVELEADDHAARRHDSLLLAEALLQMSMPGLTGTEETGNSTAAMAWTGGDTGFRIRRLLGQGPSPFDRWRCGVACCAALLLPLAPVAVSLAPALTLIGSAHVVERVTSPELAATFEHHP